MNIDSGPENNRIKILMGNMYNLEEKDELQCSKSFGEEGKIIRDFNTCILKCLS